MVNDTLDIRNLKLCINIALNPGLKVDPQSLIVRCDTGNGLIIVQLKVLRLLT